MKGHSITGHMACFISDQESTKGKDCNINIVNGIHNLKAKHLSIFWYQIYNSKHVTFNKGKYVGHLEPNHRGCWWRKEFYTFTKIQIPIPQAVLQQKKLMSEQVKGDAFEPPCHKLKPNIEAKLKAQLKGVCISIGHKMKLTSAQHL